MATATKNHTNSADDAFAQHLEFELALEFVRVVEECGASAGLEQKLEEFTRSISGAMGKRR